MLALLGVGVVTAEGRVRRVVPSWTWLDCFRLEDGPELPCMHNVAGCAGDFAGFGRIQLPAVPFHINSRGFRGAEPDRAPPGAFVVAALGDSNLFGLGVPDGQTWPELLNGAVAPLGAGRPAWVLNLGVPGHDLRQQLAFAGDARGPSPDLFVFSITRDDLYPGDCQAWARTTGFAARSALVRRWILGDSRLRPRHIDRLEQETLDLAASWRASQAPSDAAAAVLVMGRIGDGKDHGARVERLRAAGFSVIDLSAELAPVMDNGGGPFWTPNGEQFSAAAHARIARRLAPLLGGLVASLANRPVDR